MRAQLIRKWNSFPKEPGSSTMGAFFCQWLYWIPLQGHWATLKAISSIAPPLPHHHLSIPCSLSLLSSRSHGLICATVSFDPPTPRLSAPNADFTILHIDSLRQNHQLLCMLGLFNDRAEGRESRVTHHLAHNWFLLPQRWTLVWGKLYQIFSILCLCMNTLKFTLIARVLQKKKKERSKGTITN